jgi:hypothetical protein
MVFQGIFSVPDAIGIDHEPTPKSLKGRYDERHNILSKTLWEDLAQVDNKVAGDNGRGFGSLDDVELRLNLPAHDVGLVSKIGT